MKQQPWDEYGPPLASTAATVAAKNSPIRVEKFINNTNVTSTYVPTPIGGLNWQRQ